MTSETLESLEELEDQLDGQAARSEQAMAEWRRAIAVCTEDEALLDQSFELAVQIGEVRKEIRRVRSWIASESRRIVEETNWERFSFTDERVFEAIDDQGSESWDIARAFSTEAELPGRMTWTLQKRVVAALRRLEKSGRVKQEHVLEYGRRCASTWRRAA